MKIVIEIIDHHEQRYPTCGDWQIDHDKQTLNIKVSNLGKWQYNVLVGLHEAVEALLCLDRGITEEMVDKFDIEYEKKRSLDDFSEPGDHPDSPYRKEHFFATSIERLLAAELKVDWATYERKIDELE